MTAGPSDERNENGAFDEAFCQMAAQQGVYVRRLGKAEDIARVSGSSSVLPNPARPSGLPFRSMCYANLAGTMGLFHLRLDRGLSDVTDADHL